MVHPHALLVRRENGAAAMKNSLVIPQKVKTQDNYIPNNSNPSYILREVKIQSHKNLCMNVYSSTIHNQKEETAQMSIS